MRRLIVASFALAIALLPASGFASTITYTTAATFQAAIGTSVLDDYSAAGYAFIQNDAAMSAVLGETDYTPTQFLNANYVPNRFYCSGCAGSFRLTFTSTSVGNSSGVFGVGSNFFNDGSIPYHAFVTFGDSTTADYALPITPGNFVDYFGITSDLLINNIHFGLANGGSSHDGNFGIDNLTIAAAPGGAAVPEPGTLMLVGTGLAAAARYRRKRSAGA